MTEMNDMLARRLADLKARQDAGEHMPCPRCGRDTMKPDVHTNALSRQADIMICDECGTAEALLAFMNNSLPLTEWACFLTDLPQGDFRAVPGEEAWKEIEETQLPFLTSLYERWIAHGTQADWGAYRLEARRNCKGLTDLWTQPFVATYKVADGALMIRFKSDHGHTVAAHDVVGGKPVD